MFERRPTCIDHAGQRPRMRGPTLVVVGALSLAPAFLPAIVHSAKLSDNKVERALKQTIRKRGPSAAFTSVTAWLGGERSLGQLDRGSVVLQRDARDFLLGSLPEVCTALTGRVAVQLSDSGGSSSRARPAPAQKDTGKKRVPAAQKKEIGALVEALTRVVHVGVFFQGGAEEVTHALGPQYPRQRELAHEQLERLTADTEIGGLARDFLARERNRLAACAVGMAHECTQGMVNDPDKARLQVRTARHLFDQVAGLGAEWPGEFPREHLKRAIDMRESLLSSLK